MRPRYVLFSRGSVLTTRHGALEHPREACAPFQRLQSTRVRRQYLESRLEIGSFFAEKDVVDLLREVQPTLAIGDRKVLDGSQQAPGCSGQVFAALDEREEQLSQKLV